MEPQEHQFSVHRCPLAANGRSGEILNGRYECDWVKISSSFSNSPCKCNTNVVHLHRPAFAPKTTQIHHICVAAGNRQRAKKEHRGENDPDIYLLSVAGINVENTTKSSGLEPVPD